MLHDWALVVGEQPYIEGERCECIPDYRRFPQGHAARLAAQTGSSLPVPGRALIPERVDDG
jgi:hypothetical protein